MNTVPVDIFAEDLPASRPAQRPSPEQVRAAAEDTEFRSRAPVVPAAAPAAPAKRGRPRTGRTVPFACRIDPGSPRPLLPDRTGQGLELRRHLREGPGSPAGKAGAMTAEAALPDIFRAAYADIPIRDQRDTMERPFFSLAKKPRRTPIEYSVNGVTVKVTPGEYGIATIWDADILIWAATQITEALDREGKASRTIHFHPYQLLKGIRRHHGGDQYRKLLDALRRLRTTYVETNIRPARGSAKRGSFGWIDAWTAEESPDGHPVTMSITLSEWLYEGIIEEGGILSIHEDYFLLTGGIERWLYRVARKHAGRQDDGWRFTMRQLYEKSGSAARISRLRHRHPQDRQGGQPARIRPVGRPERGRRGDRQHDPPRPSSHWRRAL